MPPFIYGVSEANAESESAAGIAVDLLKLVAMDKGRRLQVDLLPWARCLLDAKGHRYAVVINVVGGEAQVDGLLLSKPFYRLHGVYVYSGRTHPRGLVISSKQALKQMKICGMGGHRFEAFGIPTETVDRGTSRSFDQLVAKLHLGRCDVVIGTREEIAGTYLKNLGLSGQIRDGSLRMEPLPYAAEPSLHFGVPESLPQARALMKSLNEAMDRLDRQGTVAKLIDQHLDNLSLTHK